MDTPSEPVDVISRSGASGYIVSRDYIYVYIVNGRRSLSSNLRR